MLKRGLDIFAACVGLVTFAPVVAVVAALVAASTGRPILFAQTRPGKGGRVFTLYKFRTMSGATGAAGELLTDAERLTAVGRLLRRYSLDELPQLWNVLRGDMSFVGPRPERPFFVEQLARDIPFYLQRHAVKPGLSGWAQVKYQYGSTVEDAMEKLRYDLYYIKHLSLVFDLTILIDTAKVMVSGKGAQ
jgi:lipopolysaccharide/colanic/teichoic acid biosynthesis glycosyltransferase